MKPTKLRSVRKDMGVSMRSVAKAVGASEASISRIERGLQQPSPELANKLSDFFARQINPIEIMGFDEDVVRDFLIRSQKNISAFLHP